MGLLKNSKNWKKINKQPWLIVYNNIIKHSLTDSSLNKIEYDNVKDIPEPIRAKVIIKGNLHGLKIVKATGGQTQPIQIVGVRALCK